MPTSPSQSHGRCGYGCPHSSPLQPPTRSSFGDPRPRKRYSKSVHITSCPGPLTPQQGISHDKSRPEEGMVLKGLPLLTGMKTRVAGLERSPRSCFSSRSSQPQDQMPAPSHTQWQQEGTIQPTTRDFVYPTLAPGVRKNIHRLLSLRP